MKILIIALASTLIGYGVCYSSFSHRLEQRNSVLESENLELEGTLRKLKKKMSLISRIDIKEYLELKDNKEKFNKANEILGKIMVIFLADLKLHFDNKLLTPIDPGESLEDKRPKLKMPESSTIKAKLEKRDEARREKRDYFKDYKVSLKSIKNRLRKIRLKNPINLTKSLPMKKSNPLLRKINGYFTGELFLEKDVVDLLDLIIELRFNESKITGKVEVSISRNGDRYSHLRVNGDNENIRYLKNKPKQIIIKVSPSSYLQLLYVKRNDSFIANYYSYNKFVGIAKLERK